MGVVYRGRDPVLHRELAIKVMSDSLARDDDFRSRFMQEARAAGSLQHPNVVTVYDCGEVDGHLYIAMEYVKGADLEQLQSGAVPLTTANKLEIVIGVLNGLGFAHKRGIVHRDVKPANIRVNVISPGPVETPIFGKLGLPPEVAQQVQEHMIQSVALRRLGRPEEIAQAALFLASADASFVLGVELFVDGGVAAY